MAWGENRENGSIERSCILEREEEGKEGKGEKSTTGTQIVQISTLCIEYKDQTGNM